MFDGVVQDVLERLVVLLFRLDHLRPETTSEDVVLPTVTLVEGSRVLSVQVAHAVGQVGQRRFDEQVVVVPEQAACVKPPAVAAPHPAQQLHEYAAVPVVEEDRRVVVPFRPDVVVGAPSRGDGVVVPCTDRNGGRCARTARNPFRHTVVTDPTRARHETRVKAT